ncbi:hypothetical protein TSOC_010870 [Tetrabaena socialis]|uniref:N-acetyltransferase domain-containing protein n=1 Tax=Tetrabaena socialis TaxID=47790 RepID=A0A2J7ZS44_9CHLO|nr:hypothetical protein TSOC_010870 [Tetrabaena socialis]|eukprot:PNH03088.1 hypothetical protein TSOC_010870 [Tetrabaena socialis]
MAALDQRTPSPMLPPSAVADGNCAVLRLRMFRLEDGTSVVTATTQGGAAWAARRGGLAQHAAARAWGSGSACGSSRGSCGSPSTPTPALGSHSGLPAGLSSSGGDSDSWLAGAVGGAWRAMRCTLASVTLQQQQLLSGAEPHDRRSQQPARCADGEGGGGSGASGHVRPQPLFSLARAERAASPSRPGATAGYGSNAPGQDPGAGGGIPELDVAGADAVLADMMQGGRLGGGESSEGGDAEQAESAMARVECGFCHRRLGRSGAPVMLCDGCHRPFHTACCRYRGVGIRRGAGGAWHHCGDCASCSAAWQQRAAAGPTPAAGGRSWLLLPTRLGPAGAGSRPAAADALKEASCVLAAEYGPPAVDAVLDSDFAVLLRDPRGRPVSAATLDVYGREVVVLELMATLEEAQKQGHGRALVDAVGGWLGGNEAGAAHWVVAVPPDAEGRALQKMWRGHGFSPVQAHTKMLQRTACPRSFRTRDHTSAASTAGCRHVVATQQLRASTRTRAVETDLPHTPLDSIALKTIEDLDTNYCDDFVCTSSPAVEVTVRSMARELTRGRYATLSMFQPTVTYWDGFRAFRGAEGYKKQRWVADHVQKFRANVVKLRMLDKGTSQVQWRVEGKLGAFEVDIGVTTTCEHNLLTGRVTSQKESWDLSRCSLPAAAFATLDRAAWSARQAVGDARDGLSNAAQALGGGSGGNDVTQMPDDPTKFYQGPDPGPNQDLLQGGVLVALLYLAFKLFGALEALG